MLEKVTAKKLMVASEDGGPLVDWLDPKADFPASQFMDLLESLAMSMPVSHRHWCGPRPWLHACTWYDDGMDESLVTLATLVGLDEVPARQWGVNDFEPFLADLERTAASRGVRERLYVVERTQSHLVVSFETDVFDRLVSERLLLAHAPERGGSE